MMAGPAASAAVLRKFRRLSSSAIMPPEFTRIAVAPASWPVREAEQAMRPAPLLNPVALSHQRQKLVASLFALAEGAQHRARHRTRVLLFHAPHHHAKVARLADHSDSHRIHHLLDRLRD